MQQRPARTAGSQPEGGYDWQGLRRDWSVHAVGVLDLFFAIHGNKWKQTTGCEMIKHGGGGK